MRRWREFYANQPPMFGVDRTVAGHDPRVYHIADEERTRLHRAAVKLDGWRGLHALGRLGVVLANVVSNGTIARGMALELD